MVRLCFSYLSLPLARHELRASSQQIWRRSVREVGGAGPARTPRRAGRRNRSMRCRDGTVLTVCRPHAAWQRAGGGGGGGAQLEKPGHVLDRGRREMANAKDSGFKGRGEIGRGAHQAIAVSARWHERSRATQIKCIVWHPLRESCPQPRSTHLWSLHLRGQRQHQNPRAFQAPNPVIPNRDRHRSLRAALQAGGEPGGGLFLRYFGPFGLFFLLSFRRPCHARLRRNPVPPRDQSLLRCHTQSMLSAPCCISQQSDCTVPGDGV